MAAPWMADFATLNKSKNLVVILLTLNKSKKLTAKSRRRNRIPMHFFCLGQCLMSPALHPGFSDL